MKKYQYFDPDEFIHEVLKAFKLDDTEDHGELRQELTLTLADRIMTTVMINFRPQDAQRLKKLLADHPELDPVDAVLMIAPDIPGLNEKLKRNIDSLYYELIHDAERMEEFFLAEKKK